MKKFLNKFLSLIIALVALTCSGSLLYYMGYLLDYNNFLVEPAYLSIMTWGTLCLSIIGIIVYILKKDKLSKLLSVVIVVFLLVTGFCNYSFIKDLSLDYINNKNLAGISLTDTSYLMENSKDIIIYIGRNDCKYCKEFEDKISTILSKKNYELTTYYTNRDSNNKNYKEFLKKYNVLSVPKVFYIKDGKVNKVWDDPTSSIDEITTYL